MKEILILHDLIEEQEEWMLPINSEDITVFSAIPLVKSCIGCFGCWTKTPGKCVIKDRAYGFSELVAAHKEFVIVSRMVFGSVSPEIKAVLDRSIGFILPFFRLISGEMHHVPRYEKSPNFKYIFYGENTTQQEKELAKKLVAANAVNFDSSNYEAVFYNNAEDMAEVFK